MGLNDINSLAHSKWNCKYHIVFAPKYRRKVFYGEKKVTIGKILRQLCEWKGIKFLKQKLAQITSTFLWKSHQRFQYRHLWDI